MSQTQELPPAPTVRPPKLGEELPIFCEKCGYSLNGLPVISCSHCKVLQFECPECGHHQPINTLRPAFQRILGRSRAFVLAGIVFVKINFFFWLLLAWFGMGGAWSYHYSYQAIGVPGTTGFKSVVEFHPLQLTREAMFAFALFALPFGIASRMMLLRWRRAGLIGIVLAVLVLLALTAGAAVREYTEDNAMASPWTSDWATLELIAGGLVCVGCIFAWPIWAGLVKAFLPARSGKLLLEWQKSLSDRAVAEIGRT